MSSYPTEAELYRYMVVADRAAVQVCAQMIFTTKEKTAENDAYGIHVFGSTETYPNKPDVDIDEENLIERVPLDAVWGKFKESPFDLDILEQAIIQRCELVSKKCHLEHDFKWSGKIEMFSVMIVAREHAS